MDLNNYLFDFAFYLLKPNVGQSFLRELIGAFSKKGVVQIEKSPSWFREGLESSNIEILPFWDKSYPKLLKETRDFPPLLFLKGDKSLLSMDAVTIVGSRNMDEYGDKVLQDLFKKRKFLKDFCFVSGLAYGVDTQVHRLCLKNNLSTIGVLGGGMDKKYYRGNGVMYQYLSKYRLVVSEFPPDRKYFKAMFPLRNRILAGLSKKTFVIQAADVSGALNTATHANNYGRDVYVLPHDIYSDVGKGCLKLLLDGANPLLDIDDFVDKIRK